MRTLGAFSSPLADGPSLHASVVEAVPDAVVVADERGRIVLANGHAADLFGWPHAELIGQPHQVLLPERHRGLGLLAPELNGLPEVVCLRRDGTEFPAEVSIAPIDKRGRTWACVSIRDLTERHRIQGRVDQVREDLIANVSHEMRTPLTSIIGYLELVLDTTRELPDHTRAMLEVAQQNAHRELSLVNDLLTVAAADDEGPGDDLIDLGDVVTHCVTRAQPAAVDRGVALTSLGDGHRRLVHGRRHRLRQVVDNLISNALKFTPPGGSVRVRSLEVGGRPCIQVVDTGTGIPDDELPLIFERLYRTSAAVAACTPGAGIGLSLVKAIVQAHGGAIDVTSTLGEGSTFSVLLPPARTTPDPG